jgi:hypothetical protein
VKNCNNLTANIRLHRTKFICSGEQSTVIFHSCLVIILYTEKFNTKEIHIFKIIRFKDGEEQIDRSCEKLSVTGKKERNILQKIQRRNARYTGHVLGRSCFLKHVVEGKIEVRLEVKGRRGRRRNQLLNNRKERRG